MHSQRDVNQFFQGAEDVIVQCDVRIGFGKSNDLEVLHKDLLFFLGIDFL